MEHKNLVNVIQGVHQKLRKAVFSSGDPDKVWADHLKENELRKKYANAMFKLATEMWKGKECRIEWTYKTCLDYFYNGGLERSLIRQMKIKEVSLQKHNSNVIVLEEIEDDQQNIYKNLNRKLKLLDIGSCYNPFSRFKEFECTAVDLTPATKDVLQCDFLTVKITQDDEENSDNGDSSIFFEQSFDIVVMSLVLEYLPACEQRATFCYKSWQLLQGNGLCIIITPDSKCVNHNAHMMKSWKLALEKLGFVRVKYDKLQHVHCMAFRKLKKENKNVDWYSSSKLLYIPQDFADYTEKEEVLERTYEENLDICNSFLELPNEDIF